MVILPAHGLVSWTHHLAAGHHELHALHRTSVRERMAIDGDDVCHHSARDGSHGVRDVKGVRGVDRRGADCLERRKPRAHQCRELRGVLSVRQDAAIGAEHEPHSRAMRVHRGGDECA